jgi:putative transposase
MTYLQKLRNIVKTRGSANIVYVDEAGFAPETVRLYAWAKRGTRICGEHSSQKRPRISVIAAHRKNAFLAPMMFTGTADTALVNAWFEQMLIPELHPNSTIIFDNAAFHNKIQLTQMAKKYGHHILFLPPYSPDFNPIEQDFGNIKKIRQFSPPNTPIENIIKSYKNY